jgi:hypothetical protein
MVSTRPAHDHVQVSRNVDVELARSVPTYLQTRRFEALDGEGQDVKYLLLIYNNPKTMEALSEQERSALMGDVDSLVSELTTSGELTGGEALAHPRRTGVSVEDGGPADSG